MTMKTNESEKPTETLLPCPFCGGTNLEVILCSRPCVVCFDCAADGAAADRLTAEVDNRSECREQARQRWNVRKGGVVSSQLPTQAGPYWWRAKAGDEWTMVHVADLKNSQHSPDLHGESLWGVWSAGGWMLRIWAQYHPPGQWIAIPRPEV